MILSQIDDRIAAADRALLRASFAGHQWAVSYWRQVRDTLARQRQAEVRLAAI